MHWDTKRRLIYAFATLFVIATLLVISFRKVLFPDPTCVDMKQNGFETGVDCGGECALRCSAEVYPLSVLWSTAVKSSQFTYDIVGLVSNKNINNASRALGYTFTAYSEKGDILDTFNGTTTAPLDGEFPIIIQNVTLSEAPFRVGMTLNDTAHYKVRENPATPTVSITNRVYEAGTVSRVYAQVKNNKQFEVRDLEVRVLLLDAKDNVFAVGTTLVPFLTREESRQISFTWNKAFEEAPTRILVYPIFSPFQVRE